jgi:hypothetical protein
VADEPKVLIPPPVGLGDPQFADIPAGAIDAVVIHPLLTEGLPVGRKPNFSDNMEPISGRWLEKEWPVVVGAYRRGEPDDAIALDQVMLRQGESEFELWIPSQPYDLRVATLTGGIDIDVESIQTRVRLRRAVSGQEVRAIDLP